MTATPAERQASYRARQQRAYSRRLNLYLPEDAGNALERLARHNNMTQADVIAKLLLLEDRDTAASLPDTAIDTYYGVRPRNAAKPA